MENKYILVKLDYSWADEFYVNALWVTTQDEYNAFLDKLETLDINDSVEIYFGTNEWISFYSYESLYESLSETNISKEFHDEFIKSVGSSEFGLVSIPSLVEYFEDAEELEKI